MKASLLTGLAQPDRRSCGAAALVAAQMLLDPAYADHVAVDRASVFAREALATHRRVTRVVDAQGAPQLPWPRVIGTPPWAVARQMSALHGPGQAPVDHHIHLVWRDHARLVARMAEACASGRPVPFYVGSRWLPRHVVLAVAPAPDGLQVYNPTRGTVGPMRTSDFVGSTLRFGRWSKPWFVVLPDTF